MSFLPDSMLDHLKHVTEAPDLAGTRYRIEEEIGRGGMGIVYCAWDSQLERRVALKVIEEGPLHEPQTLAQLEHPGLVPIYDSGTLADGRVYYAMRLVEGHRLDRFLRAEPSLPARLRVFEKICEAVAFAHDRGVAHRDLKPQNIMTGSFGEVFVMDWGIAAQLSQAPDAAAVDIAALGRILREMLPSPAPRALAAVSQHAFPTVPELAADVARYLDGIPVTAYDEGLTERTVRFARQNQMLLLLLLAFVVAKFAVILLFKR